MIEKNPTILTGKDIFMLYDSYGFPVELTKEIAQEKWITIDQEGFEKAMEEAREKSRNSTKDMFKKWTDWSKYLEGIVPTVFVGYNEILFEWSKIIKDFEVEGQRVVIFDKTPFYAESGGQTWDKGKIILDDWKELTILDVKKYEGVFLHFVK
jgi:alanyl-tRNA synthetase